MAGDLNRVSCGTDYSEAATIKGVYQSGGGVFLIEDNTALYELQYGGLGVDSWSPEAPIGTGGGSIPPGVTGIRFRNAVAGAVARVTALIRPKAQPYLSLAFPSTETSTMITGRVNAAGVILSGTGYTVTKGPVGQYTLNFTANFASVPVVLVSCEGGAILGSPGSTPTVASVLIAIVDTGNVVAGSAQPRDQAFGFVAFVVV